MAERCSQKVNQNFDFKGQQKKITRRSNKNWGKEKKIK